MNLNELIKNKILTENVLSRPDQLAEILFGEGNPDNPQDKIEEKKKLFIQAIKMVRNGQELNRREHLVIMSEAFVKIITSVDSFARLQNLLN